GRDAARTARLLQRVVVALILIGVRLGEGRQRLVEDVTRTEVAGDRDPVAGAGVSAGEGPAARPPVRGCTRGAERFKGDRPFPVFELAYVVVALVAVGPGTGALPAEEDVARRLHQALACNHPLAAVLVLALAGELLEHRALRLLDLQEQRIAIVNAEEERDPGARPDAADAD